MTPALNVPTLETAYFNGYDAFSSLSIHGISTSGRALNMTRAESFPANRTSCIEEECSTEKEGWDALPLPEGKSHLEIEIIGEQLGHGRISATYAARLHQILNRPGGSPLPCSSPGLPQEFCIKVAKPQFFRSLAREAWFYEQLAGLQGSVTPRCFGFFVAPLPEGVSWLDAWGDIESCKSESSQDEDSDEDSESCLPDSLDDEYQPWLFHEDGRQSKSSSRWNDWRQSLESPLVGVLLLELGSQLERRFESPAYFTEQEKRDLADLFDDLASVGIIHADFKFNNILHVTRPDAVICPRHCRVHHWQFIDFDRARKWGKSIAIDDDFYTESERRNLKDAQYFWCV
ncbi:hypothetical protein BDP27DRAFT_1315283 [Rhodocollybia butyracea]|uniref:Protein kinase domain-containing protein n=1 Tax=Rhodocollybia butyracea TaxID=206335 RepID=A0A9P5Q5Q3_9AGAR|nr:hypothetical protein BDP27DRAFT_1315283 [Rhodocollybia butyracea]